MSKAYKFANAKSSWSHKAYKFGNAILHFNSQVTMILHEVLRLYRAVVMLGRTVHNKTKLGHLSLPAGVMLSLPTVLVNFGVMMQWSWNQRGFQESYGNKGSMFLSSPWDMHWTLIVTEGATCASKANICPRTLGKNLDS